jgi:predicted nuclease of restriction endonuclease-like (RecB) superfamily
LVYSSQLKHSVQPFGSSGVRETLTPILNPNIKDSSYISKMDEMTNLIEYKTFIRDLKAKIASAKSKVAIAVNSQLIELYWEIGKEVSQKTIHANWGSNVIEQISIDLRADFPEMKGFSRRNLYSVKQWFEFYNQKFEFVPQAVAQIPWGHNRLILSKTDDIEEALFYCNNTIKNGWSRNQLENQIESNLYSRNGLTLNNFETTLPQEQRKLASQILKDPYNFDFINLHDQAVEREIEKELTDNITDFLIELGKGFAFVGKQFKIEVSENDYFIDLLFYHLELRCYIIIELKAGKFKPEYAGKLNFYLSAVDSQIKKDTDNPSIGLILCKSKDKIEAEYALRDISKPIGISEYIITQAIPENIKTQLPSIEELELELNEKIQNRR